jgi:hypothetical protein
MLFHPIALTLLSKVPAEFLKIDDDFVIINGWVLLRSDLNE